MLEKTITFDRFVRGMLITFLVGAILFVTNYLSSVLLPFFIAWLLAYSLYPIVKFVQCRLHVPGRVLSIIVTLLFVIAVIGSILYLIIPPMIEQFEKLGTLSLIHLRRCRRIETSTPPLPPSPSPTLSAPPPSSPSPTSWSRTYPPSPAPPPATSSACHGTTRSTTGFSSPSRACAP